MTKLIDIAAADGRFYTLVDMLRAVDFETLMPDARAYTLLAPTDDAFAVLQVAGLSQLMSDEVLLTRILRQHLVPGRHDAAELVLSASINTLDGTTLNVRVENGEVYVADARLILRDIEGDEGVMHALDKMLTPAV